MFHVPSTVDPSLAATTLPDPTPSQTERLEEFRLQIVLADATLICLESYAKRKPFSLQQELTPRLTRLRSLHAKCTEWINLPQALDSQTFSRAVKLLQDESDALEALISSLTPQSLTLHLQDREKLAERARKALRQLPPEDRNGEAARGYFDALMRLDTTSDERLLTEALADTKRAVDRLCAHVASRVAGRRLVSTSGSTLRPSQQAPQIPRGVLKRPPATPEVDPFHPSLSSSMPPPLGVPKRRRIEAPSSEPMGGAPSSAAARPASSPDFLELLAESL
ncbi:hypothetical protein [Roseateles sp.]|uniref:hypothetical protein n=1 Tax=Roseateles sp. TaxID=1971397 RepID=UPI0031DAAC1A